MLTREAAKKFVCGVIDEIYDDHATSFHLELDVDEDNAPTYSVSHNGWWIRTNAAERYVK